MNDRHRMQWLDAMKGVGILLVMICHYRSIPTYLTAGFMALFFIAAGITYRPSISLSDTIIHKGKRLLIPWLVYGLVIISIDMVFNSITHRFSMADLDSRLLGLLYMRSSFYWPYDNHTQGNMTVNIGPMWFLVTLFVVFLYMHVYERLSNKKLYLIVLVFLTFVTYNMPIQFPWGAELALMGVMFLLSGRYGYQKLLNSNVNGGGKIAVFACMLITYTLTYAVNGSINMIFREYGCRGLYSIPLFFVIGISYTFIIGQICKWAEKTTWLIKPFVYTGQQSMRLLCIHMPINSYYQGLVYNLKFLNESPLFAQVVIYLALIFFVNYF